MKSSLLAGIILLASANPALRGYQNLDQTQKMESSGDSAGARAALAQAVQSNPGDARALTAYAEFLDRYGDPAARETYARLLAALRGSGDSARAAVIAKRLAVLDLLAGDRDAAVQALETYSSSTGRKLTLPDAAAAPAAESAVTASIPGPIRSFARMAALSPDAAPADILPALARNVVTNGYQASHNNEALEQTEYLKLVHRYLSQARELDKLAGDQKILVVDNCESPKVADLLRILGFRMRGGCGSEVVLETVNASRAFLTTDSGFPVNDLERPCAPTVRSTTITTPPRFPCSSDQSIGPVQKIKRPPISSSPSSPIRPPAASIWDFPSWTARPPMPSGKPYRQRACGPTPTCWTSSAACSNFATARPSFPEASVRLPHGPSWRARRPTRARPFSISCSPRTMDGWPASTMRRPASRARSATTLPTLPA